MVGLTRSISAVEVRTVDANDVTSHEHFRRILGTGDEPLLLKRTPFSRGLSDFTIESLGDALSSVQLPDRQKKGKKSSPGACSLIIADQGDSPVIGAQPKAWDSTGSTFADLVEYIKNGAGFYLSTRSGKGACHNAGHGLTYSGSADISDPNDVLVKELVPRAPAPSLLPMGASFQMVFWMGNQGNNFGLHSDLFSEQFLVQNQGVKEIFLLLPEDASLVAPFSFLQSPLFYKSEQRTVTNLKMPGGLVQRAILNPGDVLYIPPWWWHEVCTVSPGPSLSTTFRFHTEDDERFNSVMRAFFRFHENSKNRSELLAKHVRSYFMHALAVVETGDCTAAGSRSRPCTPAAILVLAGLATCTMLGFVAGRRSIRTQ